MTKLQLIATVISCIVIKATLEDIEDIEELRKLLNEREEKIKA